MYLVPYTNPELGCELLITVLLTTIILCKYIMNRSELISIGSNEKEKKNPKNSSDIKFKLF